MLRVSFGIVLIEATPGERSSAMFCGLSIDFRFYKEHSEGLTLEDRAGLNNQPTAKSLSDVVHIIEVKKISLKFKESLLLCDMKTMMVFEDVTEKLC